MCIFVQPKVHETGIFRLRLELKRRLRGKDSAPNLVVARDNAILDNSTAMTGIKIKMSTGNIATGTATLYGVKK